MVGEKDRNHGKDLEEIKEAFEIQRIHTIIYKPVSYVDIEIAFGFNDRYLCIETTSEDCKTTKVFLKDFRLYNNLLDILNGETAYKICEIVFK